MVISPRPRQHVHSQLIAACACHPFTPFRIRVEGGIAFEVRRPELLCVGAAQIILARDADRVVIDPANVTAIEPIEP